MCIRCVYTLFGEKYVYIHVCVYTVLKSGYIHWQAPNIFGDPKIIKKTPPLVNGDLETSGGIFNKNCSDIC